MAIVGNALRGDTDLLLDVSQADANEKAQEAFSVLIASATILSTKLPHVGELLGSSIRVAFLIPVVVEYALQTLHEIASKLGLL